MTFLRIFKNIKIEKTWGHAATWRQKLAADLFLIERNCNETKNFFFEAKKSNLDMKLFFPRKI
jgi:hypothetical protein